LSNVHFHEQELIHELEPDEDIVMLRCNYGCTKYPEYHEPVKLKKTNRGRKKKEKKKKIRRKQGDGGSFNSQITFVVRSSKDSSKVYKFKVFRTGKLQLPGVKSDVIDDVIECTHKIARMLNWHLHMLDDNPVRQTAVINLNPVMKNYKFKVKIPEGSIIDLAELKKLLTSDSRGVLGRTLIDGNEVFDDKVKNKPVCPKIFMIKYNRQDTKLSIKFLTGIYKKPNKKTRINIFMRGKINILGAFNAHITRQICEYLHWIFKTFPEIIVTEGVSKGSIPVPTWTPNIASISDDEFDSIIAEYNSLMIPLPTITDQEFASTIEYIITSYTEMRDIANIYAASILLGL
jgi:TATA-box binding protein (TBP) (component of TFIID and TFIIIB)